MTAVLEANPQEFVNLLNYDCGGLSQLMKEWGQPAYRAQQICQWIHQYGYTDFTEMSNLPKTLRAELANRARVEVPEIAYEHISTDGTRKWMVRLADGNNIETVYIPETGRGTLCISSQVGCALNCSFCRTATTGYNRNLTVAEIIGQVWLAARLLSEKDGEHDRKITNVVFMGMGEPLLNLENVLAASNLMMDDYAYGLSKYRVTISTSGVIPGMLELKKHSAVSLAVSLHAATDELRDQLVPINRKYPLVELLATCKEYYGKDSGREIMMEYVMLAGVNDSLAHAKQLRIALQGIPCKVNLIPFNPFTGTEYTASEPEVVDAFKTAVQRAGIIVTVRKTRGDDILAACGQLAGNIKDRTSRNLRFMRKIAINPVAMPNQDEGT